MRKDQDVTNNHEALNARREEGASFVAFVGKMRGRGSGAAEKFSPRAELLSITLLLLFGTLILVVAYREGFSRF